MTDAIECSLCLKWTHRTCAKISKKALAAISSTSDYWYCQTCSQALPFYGLDDESFVTCISMLAEEDNILPLYERCQNFEFKCFDKFDYKYCDFDKNLDPDSNSFFGFESACKYFTQEKFCSEIQHKNGLTLLHFNCRSIKASINGVKNFVSSSIIEFDVITVSETWLTDSDDVNCYTLPHFNAVFSSVMPNALSFFSIMEDGLLNY